MGQHENVLRSSTNSYYFRTFGCENLVASNLNRAEILTHLQLDRIKRWLMFGAKKSNYVISSSNIIADKLSTEL